MRRLKLVALGILLAVGLVIALRIGHAWQWFACLALAFSWLGDVFLARYEPLAHRVKDPFLSGMLCFAIAQIAYIVAFWRSLLGMPALHAQVPGLPLGIDVLPMVLPAYLLLGALCWVWMIFRTQQPTVMKVATLLYALLLCTMGGFACAAAFTGATIVWPLMLGGALFMVSDGAIAAHAFAGRMPNEKRYELLVWGTYLPAQILLLVGISWLY